MQNGTVTLRRFGREEQETLPAAEFRTRILKTIRERELDASRIH